MNTRPRQSRRDPTAWAIAGTIALYAAACFAGLPQAWTAAANSAHHAEHAAASGDHPRATAPPAWTVAPFVLLLAAIAVLPLVPAAAHWWESNLHRFLVAVALGLVTLAYYALLHRGGVDAHWPAHSVIGPQPGPVQIGFVKAVLANAILQEYIPFIVLLFSLYTISGGIRIEGDLRADPLTNAGFMAVGGALASLVGTTGAAMLLIRPLLETNQERKHVAHTIIFFIFIVCNCGGCLLPIGDPPLFLGYLEGVDFLWTLNLWDSWLFVNGTLVWAYLMADYGFFYPREAVRDLRRDAQRRRPLTIRGLGLNGLLLVAVVLAVAFLDPRKTVPGTEWQPWMYLREAVQLGLVAASLVLGPRQPRLDNNFSYAAIIEVAVLFLGIFICMQPALEILRANGAYLVERFDMGPAKFYWATGALSSVLDNAPTYLVFFQTARGESAAVGPTAGVEEAILVAISLGAVFGGAMTYIGNGPNFMVKAIAEKSGVPMPSFFGYMVYSCLVLLPILALNCWFFLA